MDGSGGVDCKCNCNSNFNSGNNKDKDKDKDGDKRNIGQSWYLAGGEDKIREGMRGKEKHGAGLGMWTCRDAEMRGCGYAEM